MGMYRTAVSSGRLPIEFVPEPYRTALIQEEIPPDQEDPEADTKGGDDA